jgi:hypothetical protein
VLPSTVNGTELSAAEFRDALLLRYARSPPDLPSQCDGCLQKFSIRHALECKTGGLVIEIQDELSDLASKALSPSAVRNEPTSQQSTTVAPQQGSRTKKARTTRLNASFATASRKTVATSLSEAFVGPVAQTALSMSV